MNNSITHRLFLTVGAVAGWFAVILQLYLFAKNDLPTGEMIIRFLSFFTILTNLLLAVYFTVLLFHPGSKLGKWFALPRIGTSLAVYILLVGAVYNTILRWLWKPEGWQMLVDELLHTIIPVFFALYWLLLVPKKDIQWKHILPWMAYPLIYLVYVLVRGAVAGWYPYPFLDVNDLGYGTVLLNSLGVTLVFLFFSILMVGIAKMIARRT